MTLTATAFSVPQKLYIGRMTTYQRLMEASPRVNVRLGPEGPLVIQGRQGHPVLKDLREGLFGHRTMPLKATSYRGSLDFQGYQANQVETACTARLGLQDLPDRPDPPESRGCQVGMENLDSRGYRVSRDPLDRLGSASEAFKSTTSTGNKEVAPTLIVETP